MVNVNDSQLNEINPYRGIRFITDDPETSGPHGELWRMGSNKISSIHHEANISLASFDNWTQQQNIIHQPGTEFSLTSY